MADYDRFLRWQKAVISSEVAYKRKIRGSWSRHRSQLVDVVSTYGVSSPFLVNQMVPIFESLQREVGQIGAESSPLVISKSTSYVSTQLDQARTFIPAVPDVDQLTLAVELPVIRTGSVAVLQGRVISTLPRLSGETLDDALGVLFNPSPSYSGRASIYRVSQNTAMIDAGISIWSLANATIDGFIGEAQTYTPGRKFQRQALAAVDERTTECCLWVHGQIVGISEPFTLLAEPKFNDEQMDAPFHWNCRTGVSLYIPEFEGIGITTDEMRGAAYGELEARIATGKRVEIHPAHVISGR